MRKVQIFTLFPLKVASYEKSANIYIISFKVSSYEKSANIYTLSFKSGPQWERR